MQSGRINSLLTAILQSKGKHIILESESSCTSWIFSIDGESHIFVYLKGRAKIYVQLLKLIPRGHNSSWPLLWLSIKHALKDVPFPLSATLIWTAELPRPGPWIGFSFQMWSHPPWCSSFHFLCDWICFLKQPLNSKSYNYLWGYINNVPKLSHK